MADCTHRHLKRLSPSYKISLFKKENVRLDFSEVCEEQTETQGFQGMHEHAAKLLQIEKSCY